MTQARRPTKAAPKTPAVSGEKAAPAPADPPSKAPAKPRTRTAPKTTSRKPATSARPSRSRKHLTAFNRAVKAAGLDENGVHAPLIEYMRTMARQMDAAGNAPSARVTSAYLSGLKDLRRITEAAAAAAAKAPVPPPVTSSTTDPAGPPTLTLVERSPLEQLRDKKQGAR